jgi:RsmE family RNA methyltransferase
MNLLLLTAVEAADPLIRLRDDRAKHIREVLRATPGDQVRVGILDGAFGRGIIRNVSSSAVTLECKFEEIIPARSEDTLLLAVPRPPVLARCLTQAATLGFGQIILIRSWRVDKSHLASKVLAVPTMRQLLIEGLAQGRRTHIPALHRFDLFKPFVEDHLESIIPGGHRFVGHPSAETQTSKLHIPKTAAVSLAIGPEGGFIPFEVRALQDRGFQAVQAGPHPLRVETAIAYLAGQLHLLRNQSTD